MIYLLIIPSVTKPMKIFLLSLGLLAFVQFSFAQEGSLVTLSGDSLVGNIKIPIGSGGIDYVHIKLGKEKKRFPITAIRRAYLDGNIYEPVKYERRYRAMQLIVEGYMKLYAYRLDDKFAYDQKLLMKRDGSAIPVPNLQFKKRMLAFVSECPKVQQKIEGKEFKKTDLEDIVRSYNNCITSQTEEIYVFSETAAARSVESFMTKVRASKLRNEDDILSILNDLKRKVVNGDVIPNYLSQALLDNLSDNESLKEEARTLLNTRSGDEG